MLLRLLIILLQVKVSDTSESLINEIRQFIYSSYKAKWITEKV